MSAISLLIGHVTFKTKHISLRFLQFSRFAFILIIFALFSQVPFGGRRWGKKINGN